MRKTLEYDFAELNQWIVDSNMGRPTPWMTEYEQLFEPLQTPLLYIKFAANDGPKVNLWELTVTYTDGTTTYNAMNGSTVSGEEAITNTPLEDKAISKINLRISNVEEGQNEFYRFGVFTPINDSNLHLIE